MPSEFLHTKHAARCPEQEFNSLTPQNSRTQHHGPYKNHKVISTGMALRLPPPAPLPPHLSWPRSGRESARPDAGYAGARVTYRCVTNDHKLSSLKRHLGGPGSGPRRGFIWGPGSSSKVTWLLADLSFLQKLRSLLFLVFLAIC